MSVGSNNEPLRFVVAAGDRSAFFVSDSVQPIQTRSKKRAAYIVHACTQYPKLLAALQAVLSFEEPDSLADQASDPRLREERARAHATARALAQEVTP